MWFHILFSNSIEKKLQFANITELANTVERIPKDQPKTIVHSGHVYTFAFDIHTTDLITAWGSSFRLHPLDSSQYYPNLFLNSATDNHPTVDLPDGSAVDRVEHEHAKVRLSKTLSHMAISKAQPCPIEKEIELRVFLTPSFIKMFENNGSRALSVISVLHRRVSKLFMFVACTSIYISGMYTVNETSDKAFQRFNFKRTSSRDTMACSWNQSCDIALFLLQKFGSIIGRFGRIVLFTDYYLPQSTIVGAAFQGHVRTRWTSKLWI